LKALSILDAKGGVFTVFGIHHNFAKVRQNTLSFVYMVNESEEVMMMMVVVVITQNTSN